MALCFADDRQARLEGKYCCLSSSVFLKSALKLNQPQRSIEIMESRKNWLGYLVDNGKLAIYSGHHLYQSASSDKKYCLFRINEKLVLVEVLVVF